MACKGAAHEPHERTAIAASPTGSASVAQAGSGVGSASTAVVVTADAAVAEPTAVCVPRGNVLAAGEADKRLRICSDDKKACVDADPATGALTAAPYAKLAAPALTSAKLEKRDSSLTACFKDKCRDIGKNARALIARDPDVHTDGPNALAATTDVGGLVIPKVSPQLWDIVGDREIKLRAPSGEKDLGQMMVAGDHVIATWLPNTQAVYRRNGALVASLGSDGSQLAMIDDTRAVALTPDHRVLIFGDPEHTHTIELGPSVGNYDDWVKEPGALAVLADGTVAIVIERASEAQVVLIDPQRGTVFRRWPVALCPG